MIKKQQIYLVSKNSDLRLMEMRNKNEQIKYALRKNSFSSHILLHIKAGFEVSRWNTGT